MALYELTASYYGTTPATGRLSFNLSGPAPIPDRLRSLLEVCHESFSVGIPVAAQLHREVMECKLKREGWVVVMSSQSDYTKPGISAKWSITFSEA